MAYGTYDNLRPDIINSLRLYADHGIETGGFLRACLENNFQEACARADEDNVKVLREIALYIHWEIPAPCHGSPQLVQDWLDSPGWKGKQKEWFNNSDLEVE